MVLFIHRAFRGLLITLIFILSSAGHAAAWGFYGHKKINAMAVFALPPPLFGFYKLHYDHVVALAVNPDKRRYAVKGEAECHYIDLDHYGPVPADSVERNWNDACIKFGEAELREHGIVPYKIDWVYAGLVKAFVKGDVNAIIRLSADLGHYVADAHVPLHCTSNYNGQQTDQYGIHGLWESRIPEIFADHYNSLSDDIFYIDDITDIAWETVFNSYELADDVLRIEKLLSGSVDPSLRMEHEIRNDRVVRAFSREYSSAYHEALDGMGERRWRNSIRVVASCWYSAWIDAGQPELIPGSFKAETSDTTFTPLPSMEGRKIHGHTE